MSRPVPDVFAIPDTKIASVVVSATAPADVAPEGATSDTVNVNPEGIAADSFPVTFLAVLLVDTEYVVVVSVASVGGLPAVAVVILRGPGFPDTLIASIEPIVYVTVAVADVAPNTKVVEVNAANSKLNIRCVCFIDLYRVKNS